MTASDSITPNLREAMARTLYEHDSTDVADAPGWDGDALDAWHPGMRGRYRARADALVAGPLARLLAPSPAEDPVRAREGIERDEELRVLRRQRMAPERERELLEANNRTLERARAAEAARASAEGALAAAQREREVARETEVFWQQFAFDADELATRRLVEASDGRAAAERMAIRERGQRERAEGALRLFADRADVMPKEGWVSELAGMNRDIPLWWFHAARVALEPIVQVEAGQDEARHDEARFGDGH